jgi:hypothetical protein
LMEDLFHRFNLEYNPEAEVTEADKASWHESSFDWDFKKAKAV